jgi:NOL1/NOP2/fmu family ribosome biogenesis protein
MATFNTKTMEIELSNEDIELMMRSGRKLEVKSLSEENEIAVNYCEYCFGTGLNVDGRFDDITSKPCFNCK